MKTERSKRCIVFGVNGQDGSYAAECLLARGWAVWGVGRQEESKWVDDQEGFSYQRLDLNETSEISALLREVQPHTIFHLAALHGSAGFSYEEHWLESHLVNTVSTHAILEFLRQARPSGVLIYISSSKVFGATPPSRITEQSRRMSTCIYSTTKNAASDLITYYRSRHGIAASVVWTFNHESPRRSNTYFIPQIVKILAHSIVDREYRGSIGTLQFWGDWGDALEYMDLVVDIAEMAPGKDFVLATGTTHWAEKLVHKLFKHYKRYSRRHICERLDSSPLKPRRWRAEPSALYGALGRRPQRTICSVCDDILRLCYSDAWALAQRE